MSIALKRRTRVVIGPPGGEGIVIEELRIAFKVVKTDGSTPNYGEAQIWNLAASTRRRLQAEGLIMQIFVGYGEEEGMTLIFLGAVTGVESAPERENNITTVTSGKDEPGGGGGLSKSFRGQQSLAGMLEEAAGPLGAFVVDTGLVPDQPIGSAAGITLNGTPRAELNRLTRANNLEWFFEDGVLRFLPRGEALRDAAVVISQATGMMGRPKSLKPSGGGSRAAIEVASRLNPDLRVRRIIDVRSRDDLRGWYIVRSVEHVGDQWGSASSTVEATPIEGSSGVEQPTARERECARLIEEFSSLGYLLDGSCYESRTAAENAARAYGARRGRPPVRIAYVPSARGYFLVTDASRGPLAARGIDSYTYRT